MKYKVAIVEDELPILELYRAKLELHDFEVKTARNGVEGIQLVKNFQPDLLLLDIRMPQMNGDEMLMKVREQPWGSNVRVIVLTNLSKDEAPTVFRFLGIDRYIVKAHHTPAQVLEIIGEVLNLT